MKTDWQTIVALFCVTVAVVLLVRRVVLFVRGRRAGCGSGCGTCPVNSQSPPSAAEGFVSLESFRATTDKS